MMHTVLFCLSLAVILGGLVRLFYSGMARGVITDRSMNQNDLFAGLVDSIVHRYLGRLKCRWVWTIVWAIAWLLVGALMLLWSVRELPPRI